jgi:hypothetical protein
MKTTENTNPKKTYRTPSITNVVIDNEISLQMDSSNPGGDPDESIQPAQFNLNPFKF